MIYQPLQQLLTSTLISRWSSRIAETLGLQTAPTVNTTKAAGVSIPEMPGAAPFESLIQDAAQRYQLPAELLRAVIKAESNFNPEAISHCGAKGLMQLMDGTAKSLGVEDSFDPAQNIDGGAQYLRKMLDRFGGSLPMALAAYNAGPGAVSRFNGIPPYKETQTYVRRVMKFCGQEWEA